MMIKVPIGFRFEMTVLFGGDKHTAGFRRATSPISSIPCRKGYFVIYLDQDFDCWFSPTIRQWDALGGVVLTSGEHEDSQLQLLGYAR